MATIRFYLNDKKNGSAHIIAAFQIGLQCPTKYIGYSIPNTKITVKEKQEYKFWNKNTARVRSMDPEKMAEINKKITEWQTKFDSYISDCNINSTTPDIPNFVLNLEGTYVSNRKNKNDDIPTLLSIARKFVKSIKSTHKQTTINGFQVVINDLEKYEKEKNKTIYLNHIDRTFYKDFSIYLIEKENNFNPTLNKKQTKLVTIITYAVDDLKIKGVNPDYNKKYRFKETQAGKFPLYPEELATLRAYVTDNSYHRLVLDSFLLACETGLRHSDICQLQPAHIKSKVTTSGFIRIIDLTNMKGSKQNSVPLSTRAAAIIDTYMKAEGYLFSFHYSQATSKVLKKIFEHKDVKLDRPCEIVQMQGAKTIRTIVPLHDVISFHMARNTYITRLLSFGVAPAFVQDNAGHSKVDITMGYYRGNDITRYEATLSVLNSN